MDTITLTLMSYHAPVFQEPDAVLGIVGFSSADVIILNRNLFDAHSQIALASENPDCTTMITSRSSHSGKSVLLFLSPKQYEHTGYLAYKTESVVVSDIDSDDLQPTVTISY